MLPVLSSQLIYLTIGLFIIILFILDINKKRKKNIVTEINLWEISLTFLFFYLALKSRRHFPLFFIVSFSFLIPYFYKYLKITKETFKNLRSNLIIKTYIIINIILLIISFSFKTNFTNNPFNNQKFCKSYPCEAISFLKEHPEYNDLKFLNYYGWGGFMIWRWPEKKLFIDGRLPQYEFKDSTTLEEYFKIVKDNDYGNIIEEKINEYQIELVMVPHSKEFKMDFLEKIIFKRGVKNDKAMNIEKYLSKSNNWEIIYEDKVSKIFIKK